jgi:hypothetical protein
MKSETKIIYKNVYDIIYDHARETIEAQLPREKDIGSDKYWEMFGEVMEQVLQPYKV